MDTEEARLQAILGDDVEGNRRNAERYRDYLVENLPLPFLVTGVEDFPWEERFMFGVGEDDEYEELKKTNPSFTDVFELEALEPPDEHTDVGARVRRVSDDQVFEIGLSWLCCAADNSNADRPLQDYLKADQLLEDYRIWRVNY